MTVRGSKTLGADGILYLVAREIRPADDAPVVVLRDRRGAPLWSGSRISDAEAGGCRIPATDRSRSFGAAQ